MANSPPPPSPYYHHLHHHQPPRTGAPKEMELELTIISAKQLKNVNWRGGGVLKAYVVFWVEPERRMATKSDDSGGTSPVWNERFCFRMGGSSDWFLTVEIFHSKPSETPKPLVGTLRLNLRDLPRPEDSSLLRTFSLSRPSGRPQGKIRLLLSLRHVAPPYYYYYSSAPPRPVFGSAAPSAPVDYSPYDPQGPRLGLGGLSIDDDGKTSDADSGRCDYPIHRRTQY